MLLKLITAPTEQPITSAEWKAHGYVVDSADDALIERYIKSATRYCERLIQGGKQFVSATYDLYLPDFDDVRTPDDLIEIPRPPLQSVTSVKYYDLQGVLQTWDSAEYIVHAPTDTPGAIELAPDYTWPNAQERKYPVVIRFVAGYGAASAVPEEIKQAIHLAVTDMYENRGDGQEAIQDNTQERIMALLGTAGYGYYG